jgi:alanine dehydrogenase
LAGGINVMQGKIRNKAVAEAHDLPFTPLEV